MFIIYLFNYFVHLNLIDGTGIRFSSMLLNNTFIEKFAIQYFVAYTFSFIPFNACFMKWCVCVCLFMCGIFSFSFNSLISEFKSIDCEEQQKYVNDLFLSFFIPLGFITFNLKIVVIQFPSSSFFINMNLCECLHSYVCYFAPIKFYMLVLR